MSPAKQGSMASLSMFLKTTLDGGTNGNKAFQNTPCQSELVSLVDLVVSTWKTVLDRCVLARCNDDSMLRRSKA